MKQTFWWGFHNFGILKQDQYKAGHFHVCKLCFQTYFWILALDFSSHSTLLFYNYWRVCPKFSQSINCWDVRKQGISHNHNFLGLVIQWYAHIRWRKPATENRIIVFFFLKDWLRACVHVMLFSPKFFLMRREHMRQHAEQRVLSDRAGSIVQPLRAFQVEKVWYSQKDAGIVEVALLKTNQSYIRWG